MKKIIYFSALFFIVLLAGCSSQSETTTETESNLNAESEIETESNLNTQTETNSDLNENSWCFPGANFDFKAETNNELLEIQGLEEFKGKVFCKGIILIDDGYGQQMETIYYFNEDESDVWAITKYFGEVSEVHIVNDEVVN